MHNLNPFGGVSNLQQYVQLSPSYQGFQPLPHFVFTGGMFVGAAAGASSHGSDSATLQSQIRKVEQCNIPAQGLTGLIGYSYQ